MRYRNRTEIISQILETANGGGATKTKIMYKAFLRYDKLQEYLMILTQSDLLQYNSRTHTFRTTEHGLNFIEAYNQIDGLMNS